MCIQDTGQRPIRMWWERCREVGLSIFHFLTCGSHGGWRRWGCVFVLDTAESHALSEGRWCRSLQTVSSGPSGSRAQLTGDGRSEWKAGAWILPTSGPHQVAVLWLFACTQLSEGNLSGSLFPQMCFTEHCCLKRIL